ncbi:hypothetical protein, partial [Vreelandella maris]|uniref:hypothetical protein n=1 Tax=Vreelandella maris TaxID=2729617 RepID=UPI001C3C2E55
ICSLALIFGDLSPTSASAHMNYLIKLLKSCFAVLVTVKATGLPLTWLASARKAYYTHFLAVVNVRFSKPLTR